jgi:large subunit ribosomal protein L22
MAEAYDIRATARFVPMAPQKVRLVLDLVRGQGVNQALQMLRFTSNAAAGAVYKVLRSAVANAEENYGLSREELVIDRAYADDGPTRRWRRFGARGRFKPQLRRSSHITVILRERPEAGG